MFFRTTEEFITLHEAVKLSGRKSLKHMPYAYFFITLILIILAGCLPSQPIFPPKKLYDQLKMAPPEPAEERAFQAAHKSFGRKSFPSSTKQLEKFLQTYPNSSYKGQALQMLGESYYHLSDCSKTLDIYTRLLQEEPQMSNGQLHWQMGECFFGKQDYKQALVEYQLVMDRYPKTVDQEKLLYKVGLCAYQLNWLEQAQNNLLRVGGYRLSADEKINLLLTQGKIALELKDYRVVWQAPLAALEVVEGNASIKVIRMGEQVLDFIKESIAKYLPADELRRIADIYPDKFPGGEALWRLAQIEYEAANTKEALAILEQFINAFTIRHPNYEQAIALRDQLEEELRIDQNKIGVIIPYSGKLAPFGKTVLRGIELAVEEENRQREKKIALIIKDSQGKSSLVAELMKELVEKERVVAILGPVLSKSVQAAAVVANDLKTPLITPAASAEGIPQSGPYVFRNCLTNPQQAASIASFAVEEMELDTFAVLYPDNRYGQELAALFSAETESWGGRIMAKLSYPPESTDFRPQIEALHKISPQAVFLPDYYDKIILIAPQIAFYSPEGEVTLSQLIDKLPDRPKEIDLDTEEGLAQEKEEIFPPSYELPLVPDKLLDWQPSHFYFSAYDIRTKPRLVLPESLQPPPVEPSPPSKMFLLGTQGWYNPQLLEERDKHLEESVFPCGFFSQNPSPLVQGFLKHFKQRFLQEPDLLAAQAYDSTNMLLQVLRQGAKTRQAVQEGLILLPDYEGVTGTGSFDLEGEIQKELAMVGVKRRRFTLLNREEPWLKRFKKPSWPPLFKEGCLEGLLPWNLYYLLEPFELLDEIPSVEESTENQFSIDN